MEEDFRAYTDFAQVYDLFMDNVPYQQWADYIIQQFADVGIVDGPVLDLGCGTGKLTRLLSQAGYEMIGIDCSMEMLQMAQEQEWEKSDPILYLLQDMRELELSGEVRAVCSACDCINYLLEEDELTKVFQLVYRYLEKGGLFLFDCNTPYKYRELLAENTFAENRPEGSFIWENYYDAQSRINEYDLTLYILGENETYQRFEETHYQKSYDLFTIRQCLEKAGLELLSLREDYTDKEPGEECERWTILARKTR